MAALLEVRNVSVRFGGLVALKNINLAVSAGEVLSVIGPNGAGKTTLFNVMTGRVRPASGEVFLHGRPIHREPAFRIARMGVVRTFQKTEVFGVLPVVEGVQAGAIARGDPDPEAYAREVLESVGLGARMHLRADQLSYGDQRLLEIAQALAARPAALLLDEPASGMNHQESVQIIRLIGELRTRGFAIILVEHNMHVVMTISNRVVVLNYGEKIAEGNPEAVRADRNVIEAYLGVQGADAVA